MLLTKILAVSAPIRYRCAESTWEAGTAEAESSSIGSSGGSGGTSDFDRERRAADGALDRMRPTRRVRTRFPGTAFDVGGFLKARGRVRDLYTYALPEPQDLQTPTPFSSWSTSAADDDDDNDIGAGANDGARYSGNAQPNRPPAQQAAVEPPNKQQQQQQSGQRLPVLSLPTMPAQRAAAARPRRTASSAGVPPAWGTHSVEEAGTIVVETFVDTHGGSWLGLGRAAPLNLVQLGSVAAPQPQLDMEWAFFVPLDTRQSSGSGAADGHGDDERMYVYRVLTQGGPPAGTRRPCGEQYPQMEEAGSVSAHYWVFEQQRERVSRRIVEGGGGADGGGAWRTVATVFGGDNFCVARRPS